RERLSQVCHNCRACHNSRAGRSLPSPPLLNLECPARSLGCQAPRSLPSPPHLQDHRQRRDPALLRPERGAVLVAVLVAVWAAGSLPSRKPVTGAAPTSATQANSSCSSSQLGSRGRTRGT